MNRIEEKAQTLLEQAGERNAPISPERIAKWLGIQVSKMPFEDNLSGVLIREKNRSVIGVNKGHSRARQRFTMAHELGHQTLGHHGEIFVDQAMVNKRDGRSAIAIDPQEIEANNFAAALLMPRGLVVSALQQRLESTPSSQREVIVKEMSKHFQVSSQAMEFRLVNLGLLTASWD